MKKLLLTIAVLAISVGAYAAEKVYRGPVATPEKILFYFQNDQFFGDEKCTNLLCYFDQKKEFILPEKGVPADPTKDAICRFAGDRIYNGFSLDRRACRATIVVTKTDKDTLLEAKIYEGPGIIKNVVIEKPDPKNPALVVKKSFTITANGEAVSDNNPACKVLYTVKDGKIYAGDSTADKDCFLSYTGNLDSKTLLYIAVIASPEK